MATDASDYPTNADSIARTNPSDNLTGHSDLHDKMADAIEEIQGFVGVSGDTTAGTIVKRVSDLEGTDIDITLTGDVTGSGTINNLGDVSITTTVGDDSHNHTIANVDDLQTTLDGKAASGHNHDSSYAATGHTHSYAATGHTHSYASDTHNHNTLYASTGHNHDDRYYTESEVNASFAGVNHGHTNMITGKRGNGSYPVNGDGYASFNHGLGSTPVAAFVQTRAQITTGAGGGEVVISLPITSVTSTQITFRAYEADAGNNNNSGYVSTIYDTTPGDTFVNVSWLVLS